MLRPHVGTSAEQRVKNIAKNSDENMTGLLNNSESFFAKFYQRVFYPLMSFKKNERVLQ